MDGDADIGADLRTEFLRRALARDMADHLRGVRVLDPAARDALAKRLQEVAVWCMPRADGADEAGGEGSGGGHGSVRG